MVLLALLALPLLLGLLGRLLGKGRVTWKEVAAHEVVVVIVLGIGYWISISARMSDNEIWNGTISRKWKADVHCCHSYRCHCFTTCSGSGTNRHCSEHCSTCYRHSRDVAWYAQTSNGEDAFSDSCNAPGSSEPARWTQIVVGEPTAIEHSYDNYIQASPNKFPWRLDLREKYGQQLPEYPRVYDHYRVRRVLATGVSVPDAAVLEAALAEMNARLGPRKWVNILVVVTKVEKPEYADALAAKWFGGKQNDLIVVIGTPSSSEIAWVRAFSWTKVEAMKRSIEQRIVRLGTFKGAEIAKVIDGEVQERFVHRPITDFAYLKESIEPTTTACWILGIIGLFLALGLQWYFWENDPFDEERYGRRHW